MRRARAVALVLDHVIGEHPQGAVHEPGHAVGVLARAAALGPDPISRAAWSGPAGHPATMASTASASAGRPFTHGPHCPAFWLASHRDTRATSTSGQAPSGSTATTPHPRLAPCADSDGGSRPTRTSSEPGIQVPK